jgi:hypothetical protein
VQFPARQASPNRLGSPYVVAVTRRNHRQLGSVIAD